MLSPFSFLALVLLIASTLAATDWLNNQIGVPQINEHFSCACFNMKGKEKDELNGNMPKIFSRVEARADIFWLH